ncbi:MAG TPA: hypothetical protein VI542_16280 [Candidatus Tectomicrobia bacterium]
MMVGIWVGLLLGPPQGLAQQPGNPAPYTRLPSEAELPYGQDRLPIPDPTRLTSQALDKAILALKDVIYTRLEGMDRALALFQTRTDQASKDLDARVLVLRDLIDERFKGMALQFEGIQLQFKERDTRVEQTARDSKTAVDAALQAAKEAVEKQNSASGQAAQKSEGAFTKQIDQLTELFRNGTKSLEDKITIANKVNDDKQSAINDRITRIEAIALGTRSAKDDSQDSTLMIIAVIGAAVGVAGVVMAVVGATRHSRVVP